MGEMEQKIHSWFNRNFCDRGIETQFYNLALAARNDLIKTLIEPLPEPCKKGKKE